MKYCKSVPTDSRGYSLIEVIVVMLIVGILASGVVFMFANPSAKVKGQSFTTLGDLNRARSEAVNRNVDVRVTFLPGAAAADQDGYRIWIDDWDAGGDDFGSDGLYQDSASGSDTLIGETFFPEQVQFYDTNATGGPTKKPFSPWGALVVGNGIEFDGADEFVFTSRGIAEDSGSNTLDNEGYVIMYSPVSATDHATMRAKPFAVVITPGVGSVRIARFHKVGDVPAWRSK